VVTLWIILLSFFKLKKIFEMCLEGWRNDSSGRAPALQVQTLEFKTQYHHQKKKKKKR
jgi:hypothetical protein